MTIAEFESLQVGQTIRFDGYEGEIVKRDIHLNFENRKHVERPYYLIQFADEAMPRTYRIDVTDRNRVRFSFRKVAPVDSAKHC